MLSKSDKLRLRPSGSLTNPRTFSPMTHSACTASITRNIFGQRSRLSSAPLWFPAVLQGWQGNPPTQMSTPLNRSVGIFRMSSKIGMFGQCFRKTAWQKRSCSQKATVEKAPVASSPRLNPPIPEKRSRTVKFFFELSQSSAGNHSL